MGLFDEQRFSDEQVTAARRKIAAGASLRAAAAEIGCVPSTLSVRIKKAEAAEADARVRAGIGDRGPRLAERTREDSELSAIAAREGAAAGGVGPVEVLRGALQATKASEQPDWPTRVTAARALAALRPDLAESEPEREPAPATFVYDLPPGSAPILHRAPPGDAPVSDTATPAEPLPEPCVYLLRQGDQMIPLVEHKLAGETFTMRILESREAAADLLRAFGGDPASLDTIPDADPQPDTT
jgi:hypothetical protein